MLIKDSTPQRRRRHRWLRYLRRGGAGEERGGVQRFLGVEFGEPSLLCGVSWEGSGAGDEERDEEGWEEVDCGGG